MEINLDSLVFNQSYIQFDALYLKGNTTKKMCLVQDFLLSVC